MTPEHVRELLAYDPSTGVFTWRVDRRLGRTGKGALLARAGEVAGTMTPCGYRSISISRRMYMAHRLAFVWMTGTWPTREVDHRNGIRDDNRWENLREVSSSENKQNRHGPQSNNTTGYLGVSWNKKDKAYTARLKVDGKYLSLGYHSTPEAASAAYLAAKRRHHPANTL